VIYASRISQGKGLVSLINNGQAVYKLHSAKW